MNLVAHSQPIGQSIGNSTECSKVIGNPVVHVDSDDFMPAKIKQSARVFQETPTQQIVTDDELLKAENVGRPLILRMLPEGYNYKVVCITNFNDFESFECEFKIKLETEDSARKWIAEYNDRTKETDLGHVFFVSLLVFPIRK